MTSKYINSIPLLVILYYATNCTTIQHEEPMAKPEEIFEVNLREELLYDLQPLSNNTLLCTASNSIIYRIDENIVQKERAGCLGHRSIRRLRCNGPEHIWASSTEGKIIQFKNNQWYCENIPGLNYIDISDLAIVGEEVWATAAGSDLYIRSNNQWNKLTLPEFAGKRVQTIFALSPNHIVLDIHPNELRKKTSLGTYKDKKWTIQEVGKTGWIHAIHGVSDNDIWAVGSTTKLLGKGGQALHFNGVSWKLIDLPVDKRLYCVYAVASDNVWVAGEKGTLLHWDGKRWQVMDSGIRESIDALVATKAYLYLIAGNYKLLRIKLTK